MNTSNPETTPLSLKVIPLGGLGEIGQNMMVIEMGKDIIVIDAGMLFPGTDIPGVDFGVPDITYLERNADRIRAILITHGHEDHIGALPYLLSKIDAPVFSSMLTNELILSKLKGSGLLRKARLHVIDPYEPFQIGAFSVEFFRVCHSIPDAMGIALRTPYGIVVHTGDFKIDHTPQDRNATDFSFLSRMGAEGVLLLCSDSTYAEIEGYTPSEAVVGEALSRVISNARGRVVIVTFASLISRIQQIINAGYRNGRKISVIGRSMNNNVKMALKLGYITDPGNVLVPIRESLKLPMNKTILIATGSQGEPTSAISRIANGNHQDISIQEGDTVVLSSSPIPGNETHVAKTIDNLFRRGAEVIYSRIATVHVRGHASKEELKTMLSITNPKYFVPVHGEYRHLKAHAKIAYELRQSESDTFVMENGDVLEITSKEAKVTGTVPSGTRYSDGKTYSGTKSNIFSERRSLSNKGVVSVNIVIDKKHNSLVGPPILSSIGFQNDGEEDESLQSASKMVQSALEEKWLNVLDLEDIEAKIVESISAHLYKETRKRPVVLPSVRTI